MQNINNSISFTGSRKFLRDADWVCRKVKSEFPMISPTRVYYSNTDRVSSNKKYMAFVLDKELQLHQDRADRRFLKSSYKFIKEVLYSATVNKIGNCSEYVSLAEMVSRMNGVKNCYRLSFRDAASEKMLASSSAKSVNHTALLISKNPIKGNEIKEDECLIIDPWLGISGRMKDVIERYKNEFPQILKIKDDTQLKYHISGNFDLSEFDLEVLKGGFPSLIYPNKSKANEFMKIG